MRAPSLLIIGNGGREHALAWKLAQDSSRPRIVCAPGHPGTEALGANLPIAATDLDGLAVWAGEHRPDLTVIGPEAPLCAGLADRLEALGLRVFGPTSAAARLEGSKVFSKDIMVAAGIPTAAAAAFDRPQEARAWLKDHPGPVVVKADGLASGKGVLMCDSTAAAEAAIDETMIRKVFGAAGRRILLEERLTGREVSVLALMDGRHVARLACAQDHKRIFDGDRGPNTGGMGAFSPAPLLDEKTLARFDADIFERALAELGRRGLAYRGVLYAGLMLTPDGPKVLEFNCRFGDPETQAILPRWDGDLLPALQACADGGLDRVPIRWKPDACVCVVMAAAGYPGQPRAGQVIRGIEDAAAMEGVMVFQAGTRRAGADLVTAGGRVLGVTALGPDLRAARERAYAATAKIAFDGAQIRRDIGARGPT